jgi:hypothetical protein
MPVIQLSINTRLLKSNTKCHHNQHLFKINTLSGLNWSYPHIEMLIIIVIFEHIPHSWWRQHRQLGLDQSTASNQPSSHDRLVPSRDYKNKVTYCTCKAPLYNSTCKAPLLSPSIYIWNYCLLARLCKLRTRRIHRSRQLTRQCQWRCLVYIWHF